MCSGRAPSPTENGLIFFNSSVKLIVFWDSQERNASNIVVPAQHYFGKSNREGKIKATIYPDGNIKDVLLTFDFACDYSCCNMFYHFCCKEKNNNKKRINILDICRFQIFSVGFRSRLWAIWKISASRSPPVSLIDLSITVMIIFRILCLYEHRVYMFIVFFWKNQVSHDFQKSNHSQDTQVHVKALMENCWAASQIGFVT